MKFASAYLPSKETLKVCLGNRVDTNAKQTFRVCMYGGEHE